MLGNTTVMPSDGDGGKSSLPVAFYAHSAHQAERRMIKDG